MIIGIAGKAGAGKDTVAKAIIEHLPESEFKIIRFADKLKDIVCLLTGCSREDLENPEFKESQIPVEWADDYGTISYRQTMQYIGTDLFRNKFHKDTWVIATMRDIDPDLYNYIIPDVRFKNEANAIRNAGGIIINVVSDKANDYEHESEEGLKSYEFDYTVYNNSTITDLNHFIKQLVDHFIKSYNYDEDKFVYNVTSNDSKKEIEQIKEALYNLTSKINDLEKRIGS